MMTRCVNILHIPTLTDHPSLRVYAFRISHFSWLPFALLTNTLVNLSQALTENILSIKFDTKLLKLNNISKNDFVTKNPPSQR